MYCSRCGTQNEDASKFCRSCGLDLTATTPIGALKSQPVPELTEFDLVKQELKEEYDILQELGRGGMAIVFKARESQLERDVAIKVLPFSLAFDKEFVERFQREARTSARLEHPNIIPIYRVGKSGRVIYFVMKFLRGKPLSAVLGSRGALPPAEIRRILIDVSKGLAYAHKSDIVHRDIKPDNIMFDEHGHAVVTDFGIAKAATGGKLTGTGMSIGTPHYMSPEQAKAQQLDGRSDIYSLGVVAYQCLTGSVPYDGEDSFSIGYKHIMEELPVPPLDSGDKRSLFEIVRRMMAKVKEERFQNAEELIQALEPGLGGVRLSTDSTVAMPSYSGARSSSPTAPTTPLPSLRGPAVTRERPKRSVAGGLLIFVVVIGGLSGAGLFVAKQQGWLFVPKVATTDSSVVARADSARADSARRSAPDSGSAGGTAAAAPRDSSPAVDTAVGPAVPANTPGKLTLSGVPQGARVTLNGTPVRGNQVDVPPGVHQLTVRAAGFQTFQRQITVRPGRTYPVSVELVAAANAGSVSGPCEQPGPSYNIDNLCFDTRPVPLSPTFIPVQADAPIFPRQATLLIKVSREGRTLEARIHSPSNVETFNNEAIDMARTLRWNPAQKNGEPVEAWVQWPFQPVRQ